MRTIKIMLVLIFVFFMIMTAGCTVKQNVPDPSSKEPFGTSVPSVTDDNSKNISENTSETEDLDSETKANDLTVQVGSKEFKIKLYDNETTREFVSRLPMTLDMSELNGNEKYYDLPSPLPNNSQRVGNINAGDLMLYGSGTLVLFYESFSTSYSYTKIGYMDDVSGLSSALGRDSVKISFSRSN